MYCPKIAPDLTSHIWLVLSKNCLVQSQFCLFYSSIFTFFCWKNHHVLSKNITWFCQFGVSYFFQFQLVLSKKQSCFVLVVSSFLVSFCPNFNLYLPTIQLNLLKNHHVLFKISPDFVKSLSCTVPYSTCAVQKLSCTEPMLTCTYRKFNLFCWKSHPCTVKHFHLI